MVEKNCENDLVGQLIDPPTPRNNTCKILILVEIILCINVNVIMVIMLANFSLLSGNSTKIDLGSIISKYNSLCFVSTKVYDIVYKRS